MSESKAHARSNAWRWVLPFRVPGPPKAGGLRLSAPQAVETPAQDQGTWHLSAEHILV
jgi:hypothetical protein